MAREYRMLTEKDRERIAELYEAGIPIYRIANALERSPSSITLELRRGYTGQTDRNGRPEYDRELSKRRLHENIHRRGMKLQKVSSLNGQESLYDKESTR